MRWAAVTRQPRSLDRGVAAFTTDAASSIFSVARLVAEAVWQSQLRGDGLLAIQRSIA